MLHRLASAAQGCLAALALAVNTVVMVLAMVPFALVKLAVPLQAVRRAMDRVLNSLARGWIANNGLWIRAVGPKRWDVSGIEALDPRGWYLVACNHQSWVDIFVLQESLRGRIPLLKFFLKRELIYVPLIGLAWWALDFPFVRRGGGAQAAKQDLATTRASCERFRALPTSVLNFLEGTRYTPEKAAAQASPYRHLLKPKAAGVAMVLATLGDKVDGLLDVTIVYRGGAPTFWALLSGRVAEVVVRVRLLPLPGSLEVERAATDPRFRSRVQSWLLDVWEEKDHAIDALLEGRAS